jgi:transcriptional regulator GlxA family with amidase domain
MAEYDRPDEAEAIALQAHWAELIVREFFRYCANVGRLGAKALDPTVAAVLDGFRKRLHAPVELTSLATSVGFSPQHLNRLFRRALGVTPLQCLASMRMEQAAQWLRDGRWSIKSIAEKCGYDDPYYFSRQFHQRWGVSPSDYRQGASSDSPA